MGEALGTIRCLQSHDLVLNLVFSEMIIKFNKDKINSYIYNYSVSVSVSAYHTDFIQDDPIPLRQILDLSFYSPELSVPTGDNRKPFTFSVDRHLWFFSTPPNEARVPWRSFELRVLQNVSVSVVEDGKQSF